MKFEIGQKWKDGAGGVAKIIAIDAVGAYPITCDYTQGDKRLKHSYTEKGVFDQYYVGGRYDLVEMIGGDADANAIAAETLQSLGWVWDGQCWVESAHPLKAIFEAAINQATHGKGQRHGGASVPFLDQPIFHYAKLHGRGFLTGQAAKKLEEAASTRSGAAFETEVLGALVYAAAAVIFERSQK